MYTSIIVYGLHVYMVVLIDTIITTLNIDGEVILSLLTQ